MSDVATPVLHTRIWQEEAEGDAFTTGVARCHGYDVYGEMLGRASWPQMLLLMIKGEIPSAAQAALMQDLLIAMANPGPRHPAVHAAMAGGVGGSPAAACLTAALAVGAGRAGGAREVFEAITAWQACAVGFADLPQQLAARVQQASNAVDIWPAHDCWPGFGPHGDVTPKPIRQTLTSLISHAPSGALAHLYEHLQSLSAQAGHGHNFCGVMAAACVDLGLSPAQGEMLHLLITLPGAAVHALEQADTGYKRFPYGDVDLLDDPDQQS